MSKRKNDDMHRNNLKADCEKCFGLCCIALYFSASEGFPTDKEAGKPCINLQSDFTCSVHMNLKDKGLKGCMAYDCFGAGQKVAQITFAGNDWRKVPESAGQMFESFLIVRQFHEMLWYLSQAYNLQENQSVKEEIRSLLDHTERLTILDIRSLVSLDVEDHRSKVNMLLRNTSESVRAKALHNTNTPSRNRNNGSRQLDYFGADMRKINLKGADLRGACLIAANLRGSDLSWTDFLGADLRDADLGGANLTNSIFLTQTQINTARGDSHTKLPAMLARPNYWSNGR